MYKENVDPRVVALSRRFDELAGASGRGTTEQEHDDMLLLHKEVRDLGSGSGLSALDESRRAALYSAVSQTLAGVQHRREINGGWSPRPEILNS